VKEALLNRCFLPKLCLGICSHFAGLIFRKRASRRGFPTSWEDSDLLPRLQEENEEDLWLIWPEVRLRREEDEDDLWLDWPEVLLLALPAAPPVRLNDSFHHCGQF